uniref:Uncharacterized protein n=1 Tax=Knipowitschia caucasica TaxID=637954 RepID=A0AAV2K865_KNICA
MVGYDRETRRARNEVWKCLKMDQGELQGDNRWLSRCPERRPGWTAEGSGARNAAEPPRTFVDPATSPAGRSRTRVRIKQRLTVAIFAGSLQGGLRGTLGASVLKLRVWSVVSVFSAFSLW